MTGSVKEAVRELATRATPDQLVVDLSGIDDALAAIGSLAEVCDAGTQVIALGDVNDVDLYRKLMRAGVQDYLVKPVSATVMRTTIEFGARAGAEAENAAGKLIAVVGARGGVGATAVATNLAWAFANEQHMRVALVDLDLFFGSCALGLDLELGRGFREALENPARIDSLFIERSMVREGENLFVLSTEEVLEAPFSFDAASLDLLMEHLRRDFPCVVIDFPRFAFRQQARVLTQPADVVLASTSSLAGMRDTLRLSRMVKSVAPDARLTVCLNRVGSEGAGELKRADFAKGAEVGVDICIPEDVKAFAESAAAGKPVLKVASRSKAARALRDLVVRLDGARAKRPPLAALRKFLRGGR
jgi:pilus assembly protein CpaE